MTGQPMLTFRLTGHFAADAMNIDLNVLVDKSMAIIFSNNESNFRLEICISNVQLDLKSFKIHQILP